jgi:hypothetical protein
MSLNFLTLARKPEKQPICQWNHGQMSRGNVSGSKVELRTGSSFLEFELWGLKPELNTMLAWR